MLHAPTKARSAAHLLRLSREGIRRLDEPFAQRDQLAGLATPRSAVQAHWLRGNIDQPLGIEGETIARLRIAAASVAAWRYRLAHGALPDAWDDLVPGYLDAVPMDPYADPPAVLRVAERDGFRVIYSVGRDRVDDGGDSDADVVFRLSLR